MDDGKACLPYPYNQDFSGIVTRVKGIRPQTRAALVNSAKVAAYLKAGACLIERNLGSQEDGPVTGRKPYWSGIRFLTERAVVKEVETIEPPFLRQKGDGPYRSTWASHDDYTNDLLAFFLHAMNYDPQYGAGLEIRGDWLISEGDFVPTIDRAAQGELAAICRMPLFKLQLIMAATAERNDGIHDAIASNYAGALEPWKKIYDAAITNRGFRLREGITLDQFTDILAALTEGFAVRHLGDPRAGLLTDDPDGNLFGMAILGLLASYVEPIDGPRGISLREEFTALAEQQAQKGR